MKVRCNRSCRFFSISQKILYQGVEIERTFNSGYMEMKPRSGLRYWLYWEAGDAIDYANARAASSVLLNPSLEVALGRHLNLNVNHIYENLTLKGERIYLANLLQARLIYNFNVRCFLRAIVQYSDVKYNPALYSYPGGSPRKRALHPAAVFLQAQSRRPCSSWATPTAASARPTST